MQSNRIPDKSWDHSVISTEQKRHSLKSNTHLQFQKLFKTIRIGVSFLKLISYPPILKIRNKARTSTLLLGICVGSSSPGNKERKKKRGTRNEVQGMTKIKERKEGVKGKEQRTQT